MTTQKHHKLLLVLAIAVKLSKYSGHTLSFKPLVTPGV
jgi:hypothetical protein